MNVSIEWRDHPGLLRVHPNGGFGTEWTFCCVVDRKADTAELSLAPRKPTLSEARAIRRELWARGFTRIEWERRNTALNRVTVVKRKGDIDMASKAEAASAGEAEIIRTTIKMKARGNLGFSHTATVEYELTREGFEAFQRAITEALLALQKTAEQ